VFLVKKTLFFIDLEKLSLLKNLNPESNNTKKELVMEAIADYHNRTCIVFEPYDGTQEDYVVITDIDSPGCSSFVGRIGGKQTIDLKVPGCDKASLSQ